LAGYRQSLSVTNPIGCSFFIQWGGAIQGVCVGLRQ